MHHTSPFLSEKKEIKKKSWLVSTFETMQYLDWIQYNLSYHNNCFSCRQKLSGEYDDYLCLSKVSFWSIKSFLRIFNEVYFINKIKQFDFGTFKFGFRFSFRVTHLDHGVTPRRFLLHGPSCKRQKLRRDARHWLAVTFQKPWRANKNNVFVLLLCQIKPKIFPHFEWKLGKLAYRCCYFLLLAFLGCSKNTIVLSPRSWTYFNGFPAVSKVTKSKDGKISIFFLLLKKSEQKAERNVVLYSSSLLIYFE